MPDTNLSAFLWSVADLLRGDFKQSDYGKVILHARETCIDTDLEVVANELRALLKELSK